MRFLSILLILGLFLPKEQTAKAIDFTYGFINVYSANADQYIISQTNVQKYSEGGVSACKYWAPSISSGVGQLIYKFNFPSNSSNIHMMFWTATFDFGSSTYGSLSVTGSPDGTNYYPLLNNPRGQGGAGIDTNLGNQFLGTNQLYLKVEMNVVGWGIMSQWLRSDDTYPSPIFSITQNSLAVPEPSTYILIAIAAYTVAIISSQTKSNLK